MRRLLGGVTTTALLLLHLLIIAACSDSSNSGDGETPRGLSGQPPKYAYIDQLFEAQFSATGIPGTITYGVRNAPDWLSIDPQTGLLSGTPTTEDIATYSSITVTALDESGAEFTFIIAELIVPNPPIIVSFEATRTFLLVGESAELSWSTQNTQSVTLEPDEQTLELQGSLSVTPETTTEYALVATSPEGHVLRQSITIVVEPLVSAQIEVRASSGSAPFEVSLTPIVRSQNAINRFYWDFEGDGGEVDGGLGAGANIGFDYVVSILSGGLIEYDSTGRSQVFTYEKPGTYTPRLRVWDADGNQTDAQATITVSNESPNVSVTVSQSNGEVPLNVTFTATVTDNEGINAVRWDFDGDGNIDKEGSELQVTNIYEQVGDFQPKLYVEDTLNAVTEVALPHISIRAKPVGSSSVLVSAVPTVGKSPLSVRFNGRSNVPNGSPVRVWQWDLDGDGTIDQETTSGQLDYVYNSPGTFYPRIQIVTEDDQVARDIKEITVQPNLALAIQSATFNPEIGEAATITTELGGTYQVQLDIVDTEYNVVKTVLPNTLRESGSYSDTWDGKDANGNILAPGAYFSLLRYQNGDRSDVLDLRDTTSGFLLYPGGCSRGLRNCGTLSIPDYPLQPFDSSPWIFGFTSNYIADYSAYMNVYTTNELVMTFFVRRPFGSSTPYEIVWNGENTDGALLPSARTSYLINLVGETLGDNAIFLSHGVEISSFTANPSILYPNREAGTLNFSLSRPASVEMWVSNAEVGGEVYRTSLGSFEAGDNLEASWNGKSFNGVFLAPGPYRISLRATDEYGYVSQDIHAMQRINY